MGIAMSRTRRKKPVVRVQRTTGATRFEWTEELLELLGVLPDEAVAAKAGISRGAVGAERRRRAIPPARPPRPPIEWTEEMLALLGTDSDAAVARELGIQPATVSRKRSRLGIPPFHPPPHDQYRRFPWKPEELALLGKVSDGELAKTLGLAKTTVTNKRQSLGLPPFLPPPRPIQWSSAMIERLGKAPDARVAEELGLARDTVALKRQALGIPPTMENLPLERNEEVAEVLRLPCAEVQRRTGISWSTIQRLREELGIPETVVGPADGPSDRAGRGTSVPLDPAAEAEAPAVSAQALRAKHRWRPEEIALVGTGPDDEIAARLQRTAGAVRTKRWQLGLVERSVWPWRPHEIERLGTASDAEVAAELGRSVSAVSDKRVRLGIRYRSFRYWQPDEMRLLGTAPDAVVAARLGRSRKSVRSKRNRLGIPAVGRATARRR